jgi:23S rRNA pseudouridine1911/1915/1917 synthase
VNIDVIYEDNHLLVVNKPSGWLSQGDKTNDLAICEPYKSYIKEKYNKPGNVFLHPAHRLDRPVSGCIILGRTSKGLQRIQKLFASGDLHKEYLAVVEGVPQQDHDQLEDWLLKNSAKNMTKVVNRSNDKAKHALLSYEVLEKSKNVTLLNVSPKTGRSHQIRVQLSHMGHTIIGDVKYGAKDPLQHKEIALHCYKMAFKHPTLEKEIIVSCKPDLSAAPWSNFKRKLSSI